ncbi:ribulokinase [Metabacillus malikii]|uniref:Ribulokinase n=1 Tax=Metabacillus malikii TaxID=1504265 RepID=A0ABT9ZCT8_9BACI|nr:ribulokinase [Metabacillus malikii]MDQ0229398.1 L-ribulokinase [Metabacillus malikii]
MKKYSIGVDYGTQSGRAVLVEVGTGREVATSVKPYTHGVIVDFLPDGVTQLETDWALQHPTDYMEVLKITIPDVLSKANASPDEVIGIGIDFTASTVLPIKENGTPLCLLERYKNNPHAYVKLWKHHAAQSETNILNEVAHQRGEKFLQRYGGKISSEWLFPKLWQVLNEAPEIYHAADKFVEATDWVIFQLIGELKRNSCTTGYKAMWHKHEGYPSKDFFKSLDKKLEHVVEEKLASDVYPIGTKAGELTEKAAKLIGLNPKTAVAIGNVDAHVAVPAVGITEPGKLLMIMGTSTCHIVLGEEERIVPGMCGVVEDGVIPGLMGYEAGQSCVGDMLEWFTVNNIPVNYHEEAKDKKIDIHQLLTEKASKLRVGESGLIALDWWNGNRSTLVDADLSGLLLGMTLQTKPEEIYRTLIEATAFGTRTIVEAFKGNGVPINEIYACGGIAHKNSFMMQIYADVLNMEISISASTQTPALGSAMFGAVAAGKECGGYDDIKQAAKEMARLKDIVYRPNRENVEIYQQIFTEYARLYDYFGRGANDVMKNLKQIKKKTRF